jgi:hypothetical protein
VVEETRIFGNILGSFNSTFIALIPKNYNPTTYDYFRPIALCNCMYKIISKVLEARLKKLLSKVISPEQFGFLEGRKIHEVVGCTQEGLHTIKLKNFFYYGDKT